MYCVLLEERRRRLVPRRWAPNLTSRIVMRADALVASSRAAGRPLASSARRARRPRASSRVVARSAKDLAPPPSRAENARVAVDASRHGARVDTVRVVDASTIVVFGATVAVTSVAVTTAAIASTRVSPLLASLRTLSESAAAATRAAERASLEVEELAKMTSATLPVTLEAMEESAREVETLAAETRDSLKTLDASEYVENLVAEFTEKMKDPTKDIRDLSDDAGEYVKRLSLEVGLLLQSVGLYLDDGTFDEDVKNLSADEAARRRRSITDAITAAKETTESAASQLQGVETRGRDLAEIVRKIALASKDVSTAMTRVIEPTSGGRLGRPTDENQ